MYYNFLHLKISVKKIESDSFQNNVDEIILNLYRLPVIKGTFSLSAFILIYRKKGSYLCKFLKTNCPFILKSNNIVERDDEKKKLFYMRFLFKSF